METEHFINRGFGWACKHCSVEDEARALSFEARRARFFNEGEAEEKEPALSTPALARWTDATRRKLFCPRCGVEELFDKS